MSNRSGRIEIIVGPMFCGKSEELIRRLRRVMVAKLPMKVFKADLDKRYDNGDKISSHSRYEVEATPVSVEDPYVILDLIDKDTQVVGIDEIQFFPSEIISICMYMAKIGIRVILSGLDMDYRGTPFGSVPTLMAVAERVDKLTSICTVCGRDATRTQKLTSDGELVDIGQDDKYTACCVRHHSIPK